MTRTELPKSFDVEADTPSDPLEGLARSRAVRLGAALVCGVGLAVSVLALVRAGQGWPDGRRPEGEPQTVGSLAPSPPPLPVREQAAPSVATLPATPPVPVAEPARPAAEAVAEPAAAPEPKSRVADDANSTAVATPTVAVTKPAEPNPATSAAATPDPVRESASLGAGPMTRVVPVPLPPPAVEPPAATARAAAEARSAAAGRAAAERARRDAFRPSAVPSGSHGSVRAYSLSENAGTIGPDGVRRVIVRIP